jgi:hypothetical protein
MYIARRAEGHGWGTTIGSRAAGGVVEVAADLGTRLGRRCCIEDASGDGGVPVATEVATGGGMTWWGPRAGLKKPKKLTGNRSYRAGPVSKNRSLPSLTYPIKPPLSAYRTVWVVYRACFFEGENCSVSEFLTLAARWHNSGVAVGKEGVWAQEKKVEPHGEARQAVWTRTFTACFVWPRSVR